MSKKTTITAKQVQQFNRMRQALQKIAREYQTPDQLRKDPDSKFHGFEDFITMAYENIQEEARFAVKGVKAISIEIPEKKNEAGTTA